MGTDIGFSIEQQRISPAGQGNVCALEGGLGLDGIFINYEAIPYATEMLLCYPVAEYVEESGLNGLGAKVALKILMLQSMGLHRVQRD